MKNDIEGYAPGRKTMKKYAIIDIDGTLTKVGARGECLKPTPPDWDSFYARCGEDDPVKEIVSLVRLLWKDHFVILCSGRRQSCMMDTRNWMDSNGVPWDQILLRADGDHRHDTDVKPELLKEACIPLSEIAFVLEDRNSMVKKWRELGLVCLQVAEGDF